MTRYPKFMLGFVTGAMGLLLGGAVAAMPLQSSSKTASEVLAEQGQGATRSAHMPDMWRMRIGRTTFKVRIENISPPDIMRSGHDKVWPAGMSHGNYAVYKSGAPLFAPYEIAPVGSGLEDLAEDGDVRPLQRYLWAHADVLEGGVFYMPVGAIKDEELWPGKVYQFRVTADPGDKLSFATMLMQSNDAVYAPTEGGIALFDADGTPISGDISDQIALWDAGTEINQKGGFGPDAGMFQSKRNSGEAERQPVMPINDGYYYPPAKDVLRVTITPDG